MLTPLAQRLRSWIVRSKKRATDWIAHKKRRLIRRYADRAIIHECEELLRAVRLENIELQHQLDIAYKTKVWIYPEPTEPVPQSSPPPLPPPSHYTRYTIPAYEPPEKETDSRLWAQQQAQQVQQIEQQRTDYHELAQLQARATAQRIEQERDEGLKQLLGVDTSELHSIRYPGGVPRSGGIARTYKTRKLDELHGTP